MDQALVSRLDAVAGSGGPADSEGTRWVQLFKDPPAYLLEEPAAELLALTGLLVLTSGSRLLLAPRAFRGLGRVLAEYPYVLSGDPEGTRVYDVRTATLLFELNGVADVRWWDPRP